MYVGAGRVSRLAGTRWYRIFGAMAKRAETRTWRTRLTDVRMQSVLLFVLTVGLYANTLGHGFVLDDGLVITDNPYVQAGIQGIPDIVSHDSFFGTLGESAYLSGGRYRPLSLVMFATETSFFGNKPFAPHLINVLLYALSGAVLLRFLRRSVFPELPLAALAATVLFVVHPLHTEVVANIKSRDEILSLLFILLTFGFLLRNRDGTPVGDRWKAAGCYALALLSKENGIILLGIAPLALFTFNGAPWKRALMTCWPLGAAALLYLGLRFGIIGSRMREVPGVLDNPYVLATVGQQIATVLHVLFDYVRLLVWPHPLTYDYSFAQVPYRSFGEPGVVAGALILLGSLGLGIRSLLKRDAMGWCAAFFIGTWLLVSGLLFNIGAPMAERFMYQASLPFIVALVLLSQRLLGRVAGPPPLRASVAAILLVTLPFSALTIARNTDWRDRDDLLIHDVAVSARSARANTYAGIACVRKAQGGAAKDRQRELAIQALGYFATADSIVPDYMPTLLNRGVAYMVLDSIPAAETMWDRARAIEPGNNMLNTYDAALYEYYFQKGLKAGADRELAVSIAALEKAVHYGPTKADAWYNLGGACFTLGDTARARASWEHTLRLDPRNVGAQQGLAALGR